jgi:hypothetical protein
MRARRGALGRVERGSGASISSLPVRVILVFRAHQYGKASIT